MAVNIPIPQALYTGTNSFGPVTVPPGVSSYLATGHIPTADYETAGNGFTLTIERHDGTDWVPYDAIRWISPGHQVIGRGGIIDPMPVSGRSDLATFVGQQIRATLTVLRPMTVGFSILVS
jgi:hypothetical protein